MSNFKYGLNYTFKFGKYKGKLLSEVLNEDMNYIIWCKENIKGFTLARNAHNELTAIQIIKAVENGNKSSNPRKKV